MRPPGPISGCDVLSASCFHWNCAIGHAERHQPHAGLRVDAAVNVSLPFAEDDELLSRNTIEDFRMPPTQLSLRRDGEEAVAAVLSVSVNVAVGANRRPAVRPI